MNKNAYLSTEECLQIISPNVILDNLYNQDNEFKSIEHKILANALLEDFSDEKYKNSCPELLDLVYLDNQFYESTLLQYESNLLSSEEVLITLCDKWISTLESRYKKYEEIAQITQTLHRKGALRFDIPKELFTYKKTDTNQNLQTILNQAISLELTLYDLKVTGNFDYNTPEMLTPLLICFEQLAIESKSILMKSLSDSNFTNTLSTGINPWRYKIIHAKDLSDWLKEKGMKAPVFLTSLLFDTTTKPKSANINSEKYGQLLKELIEMIDPSINPQWGGDRILTALNTIRRDDKKPDIVIAGKTLTKYLNN